MAEGYNGWSNRATWNVHLWLANDESLYREVNRLERHHVDPSATIEKLEAAIEAVQDVLDEIGNDDDKERRVANTAAVVTARDALKSIQSPPSDVGDFAEAIEKFCRDMWPSGVTPDGDKLADADFDEIAAAWVDD